MCERHGIAPTQFYQWQKTFFENGKTVKGDCIRVKTPLSLADCVRLVAEFVGHYNTRRLHSAIDYITPKDKLDGKAEAILAQRDSKLAAARAARKALRKAS